MSYTSNIIVFIAPGKRHTRSRHYARPGIMEDFARQCDFLQSKHTQKSHSHSCAAASASPFVRSPVAARRGKLFLPVPATRHGTGDFRIVFLCMRISLHTQPKTERIGADRLEYAVLRTRIHHPPDSAAGSPFDTHTQANMSCLLTHVHQRQNRRRLHARPPVRPPSS